MRRRKRRGRKRRRRRRSNRRRRGNRRGNRRNSSSRRRRYAELMSVSSCLPFCKLKLLYSLIILQYKIYVIHEKHIRIENMIGY